MRMPHWPVPPWQKIIKYDLERISVILERLGKPHLKLPPVIHIAGTNGKGSSAAMLRSIFNKAGYRVHCYTSPHLIEFNERIVVDGEKISDHYLFEVCERTRLACQRLAIEPSFFEGTTAAAFLAFSEIPADITIIETGLGGRLDATNVIASPVATLITPISLDHMEYLGPNLITIAAEKAGIIKPGSPCVISAQTDEVCEVLLAICEKMSAPAFCYEYDFGIEKTERGFCYLSKTHVSEFPLPSLPGDHQIINAASTIALISLINKTFRIDSGSIAEGLISIIWPGRIESVPGAKYSHLTGANVSIWLDGAHNAGGALVLSFWMRDNLDENTYLILGMTKNRNIEEFTCNFGGLIKGGYAVRVLSEPSSYSAEELAGRAGEGFSPAESLEEAIRDIARLNPDRQANVVITGSLFLIADFKNLVG